jgi:hypothetical protein
MNTDKQGQEGMRRKAFESSLHSFLFLLTCVHRGSDYFLFGFALPLCCV